MATCSNCSGSGVVDCPRCGGKGYTMEGDFVTGYREVECTLCSGSGKKKCGACNGSGYTLLQRLRNVLVR